MLCFAIIIIIIIIIVIVIVILLVGCFGPADFTIVEEKANLLSNRLISLVKFVMFFGHHGKHTRLSMVKVFSD